MTIWWTIFRSTKIRSGVAFPPLVVAPKFAWWADLYDGSREYGVSTVECIFDIEARLVPPQTTSRSAMKIRRSVYARISGYIELGVIDIGSLVVLKKLQGWRPMFSVGEQTSNFKQPDVIPARVCRAPIHFVVG